MSDPTKEEDPRIIEPDNGRCPRCPKGLLDTTNCFEHCPLFDEYAPVYQK